MTAAKLGSITAIVVALTGLLAAVDGLLWQGDSFTCTHVTWAGFPWYLGSWVSEGSGNCDAHDIVGAETVGSSTPSRPLCTKRDATLNLTAVCWDNTPGHSHPDHRIWCTYKTIKVSECIGGDPAAVGYRYSCDHR
jgi:hypothetical protein